ncbi:MAG: YncE family protein [Parachlamydiales bacterium]|nr:YncE family protein [Parachlamydiales bacterium]
MKSKISLWFFVQLVFAAHLFAAEYVFIVDNTGMDAIVRVFDQETLTETPNSPFITIAGAMGPGNHQVNIAIAPATATEPPRAFIPGFNAGNVVSVMDIDPTTGDMTHIPGSPFSMAIGAPAAFDQPFGVAIDSNANVYLTNFGATTRVFKVDRNMNYITSVVPTGMPAPSNLASVATDPSGSNIYVVSAADSVILHFDGSLTQLNNIATGGMTPYGVSIHPSLTYVYAANRASNNITQFDYPNLSNPQLFSPAGVSGPVGMSFDLDGIRMYVSNSLGGSVSVLDTTMMLSPITSFTSQGMIPFLNALDPAGKRIYITNSGTGTLSVRDIVHDTYPLVTAMPIAAFTAPYGIAFIPTAVAVGAVRNLSGSQKKNDFGLVYERMNVLTWQAPTTGASGYKIYRDGVLIATVGGNTTQYEDHNRPKGVAFIYSVSAFSSNGTESSPVEVIVQ